MMGTVVTFTIHGGEQQSNETAIRKAAEEMQRIEGLFTIYNEHDNPVKVFNRTPAGESVTLPPEIDALLRTSLEVQEQSNGAFDPALGELNKLWGFSQTEAPSSPPAADRIGQITRQLRNCIRPAGKTAWKRLNAHCQLDFGAIAKGYAIARGMRVLKENGVTNGMINAGGDIELTGSHGDRPWRIGIRHPRNRGEVIGTLMLEKNVSVVTSGDYERFYIFEGKRYHHILDPQSGMPAQNSQSATVIGKNGALVDAWSTALFVLGPKGLKMVEKYGMDALVVDRSGQLHMTEGCRSRLRQ